jgi:hypothetical protein
LNTKVNSILNVLVLGAAKPEKPVICERDVIDVMIDFLRHCKDKPRNRQQQQ